MALLAVDLRGVGLEEVGVAAGDELVWYAGKFVVLEPWALLIYKK